MTATAFSSILFANERSGTSCGSARVSWISENPLPKLSRAQRSTIKQLLRERVNDIDPHSNSVIPTGAASLSEAKGTAEWRDLVFESVRVPILGSGGV